VNAISALAVWRDEADALATQVYVRLHPNENVNSRQIREFLHPVRDQVEGEVSVVWDNASHHTANRVRGFFEAYGRFEEVRLPAYCPELNPDEGVWDWSKTKDVANACPRGFEALVSRVRSSLTRLQHRASARRWCVHHSELDLLN